MTRHPFGADNADVAWAFAAQFLQYGAALLLLPVLASHLSPTELGVWYVLMTLQSLVQLLDVGFGASFGRSFAYIFAGSTQLRRDGVDIIGAPRPVNSALLASTIQVARRIHGAVAAGSLVLLAGPGTWYLHSLHALDDSAGAMAWALFCAAVVMSLACQWRLPLLLGSGKVRENYKAIVINRGGFAMLALLLLQFEAALWSVSLAYLVSVLLMVVYTYRRTAALVASAGRGSTELTTLFKTLWHNAYRTGLVSIGAFLITRFGILLIAFHYGVSASASYAVSLQLLTAISAMALLPFNATLPRLGALHAVDDREALKALISRLYVITWLVAAVLLSGFLAVGAPLLQWLNFQTPLVDGWLLALMAVMTFLELNHGASAMVITSSNRVPFVPAALVSGVVIAIGSTVVASLGFALWAVVVVQGVTQLLYNNWKWPLDVFRQYGFTWGEFMSSVRVAIRP